jgi:hypothetical protein
MRILKNSKELLAYLKAQNFSQINSIKIYDIFTLYTIIPHEKLKLDFLISLITFSSTKMGKEIIYI